jgi:hypothetical protein
VAKTVVVLANSLVVSMMKVDSMDPRTALTLSIGVLGGLAVALTATFVTVPIWVVFLAWASFFFVGGGITGWVRSVASNLVGVVIASASLYAAHLMGGSLLITAIAVGVGSAVMVQLSWVSLLSTTPAVVIGFASTVSTVAGTGNDITVTTISHPGLSPPWPVSSVRHSDCSLSTWPMR